MYKKSYVVFNTSLFTNDKSQETFDGILFWVLLMSVDIPAGNHLLSIDILGMKCNHN